MHEDGKKVLLVRIETSPDDIKGMNAAQGFLTARGGMTSHAAVVARGMGKPCVAGVNDLIIDYAKETLKVGDKTFKKGDWISIDGTKGEIIEGKMPTTEAELSGDFAKLMVWVDQIRKLKVRTNADTPHDAQVARNFGAEGIGLCRTEHMFFSEDRIGAVREMILAEDAAGREKALAKLLPMQRRDFVGIFRAMDGLPVTIRTLDPPLHEFLPHTAEEIKDTAKKIGVPVNQVKDRLAALEEVNPMLGHRGCRLGVMYPEITAMQARAIFEAAAQAAAEGIKVLPEIMIPLVAHVHELERQKAVVDEVAEIVFAEASKGKTKSKVKGKSAAQPIKYLVGVMIELPRAAITADEIAKSAEFFSFGTNDLTQTTFGLSRDDAGKFLPAYVREGILPRDPFIVMDREGVGFLVKLGLEKGRHTRSNLKVGICGEHGGEPNSVEFCHRIGMDYVSCSPFRVPIARLAAAQAVIGEKREIKRDV
jgi:pyruvate,orthophosphate dikinase